MKKIFITLITIIALSSCNKDDSPKTANSSLKAIINGVEVNFDTFKVEKKNDTDDEGNPYTDIVVTATKSNDATKTIIFNCEYLQTGTETCYYFLYSNDDVNYPYEFYSEMKYPFVINITENSSNKIKGTFSGTIAKEATVDTNETVIITNGNFEITH